jgi:hypothetical protein
MLRPLPLKIREPLRPGWRNRRRESLHPAQFTPRSRSSCRSRTLWGIFPWIISG